MSRATCVTIDMAAIVHNFHTLRRLAPHASICAVVKGNAYGHGSMAVAQALVQAGAPWLGVATVEEAMDLRAAGLTTPILLLAGAGHGCWDALVDLSLTPMVSDACELEKLAHAAGSQAMGIHLEVDTGMARLGVPWTHVEGFLNHLRLFPNLRLEGLASHLAVADVPGDPFNRLQMERLSQVRSLLESRGFLPRWVHVANSAAVVSLPASHMNLIRCGLILYGLEPVGWPGSRGLKPAMRWHTQPLCIRSLEPGTPVGYGKRWVTQRPTLLATLPVGYADGYPRALSGQAQVLIRGQRAPVVGTVCMDLCMVDVTDIAHVQVQDEVILLGSQQGRLHQDEISAGELAQWAGTISYEIISRVGMRVQRRYVYDGIE